MNSAFITLDSETIALLLAAPNYADGSVKVSLTLPNEITRAISSRETRRNFARFARYSIEYDIDTANAEDTTDLRNWLLRLKGETVAVPLWEDGVILTADQSPGSVSLPTDSYPVRSGAEWIILDEDAGTYEIVTVSFVYGDHLALTSATTLPWTAGTPVYPLLFGRLSDRPQWKATTDEIINGTIKVQEDSDFTKRISPFPALAGIPTVGANIPDFSDYKLFTVYPTVVDDLDNTAVDILYSDLGFVRQEQQYVYQQPPARGMELQFMLETRADQLAIERIFVDRYASTRVFFCPTFKDDMRLNADLPLTPPAPQNLIPIEPSRYQDPDYSAHPGEPYIALTDTVTGAVDPHKLTLIDTLGLHTLANVTVTHPKNQTELSALMLVRFAEATLEWEYTGGIAKTTVKILEQTSEYVTPKADLVEKAFFFRITEALPNLTNIVTLYTSYEAPIVWTAVGTFNPAPLSIGQLKGPLDLSDPCEVMTFNFDPAFPLLKLLDFTNEGPLKIEIWEASVDNPADGSADEIYVGDAIGLDTTGPEWKASFKFLSELDEEFGFFLQPVCNVPLYSPKCSLLASDYACVGTIASISGLTIVVNMGANPTKVKGTTQNVNNYFAIGRLSTGLTTQYEGRDITASVFTAGTPNEQTLTLKKPLFKAIVGQAITLYPGCDFSITTCGLFNNTDNHRGHPYIPIQADMAQQSPTATGGKKG